MHRSQTSTEQRRNNPSVRAAPCGALVCIWLASVCLFFAGQLAADPPDGTNVPGNESAAESAEQSLDDQLRGILEPGLLDDLDSLPSGDAARPEGTGGDSELDLELADQLLDGDDLGTDKEGDPLTRIGLRMQVAERRIQVRKTAAVTQRLQQQAIDELAEIIEKVRKSQCSGGQCKGSNSPSNSSKSGKPSANSEGRTPAKSAGPVRSTERVDASESAEARVERRRALLKQVWGHLPEQIREKMLNTSDEEFLPKYAEIIEEYFEKLSEEGRAGP